MTQGIFAALSALGIDAAELEWQDLSICTGQDVDRFYSKYEANPRVAKLTDQMCASCPVRRECLQTGIENNEWGCWGGVFLVNGKVDPGKNSHKSEEDWDDVRELISG